eukprot:m.88075 g.88075  ORF g.88075 m.88075 type:complete len:417 (+) comp15162_c0_seq2:263-1513(+)
MTTTTAIDSSITTTTFTTTTNTLWHGTVTAPTIGPPLPPTVHTPVTLAVAIVLLAMTGILLFQVFRVWFYNYRKLSFFNVCLTLSLAWAVLRSVLMLTYVVKKHVAESLTLSEHLGYFIVPVYLQFATFSLVALYFTLVTLKGTKQSKDKQKTFCWIFWFLTNAGFLIVNVYCAEKLHHRSTYTSDSNKIMNTRVLGTEIFTICMCAALVLAVYKLRQKSQGQNSTSIEGHGITVRQITIFTAEVVPLFLSRAIYNIVALTNNLETWGYRFTFLSDRYDRANDSGETFILFVACLFIWECIPVFLVMWFFWIPAKPSYLPLPSGNPNIAGMSHNAPFNSTSSEDELNEDDDDDDDQYKHVPPSRTNNYLQDLVGTSPNYGSFSNIQSFPYGTTHGTAYQSSYPQASTPLLRSINNG